MHSGLIGREVRGCREAVTGALAPADAYHPPLEATERLPRETCSA